MKYKFILFIIIIFSFSINSNAQRERNNIIRAIQNYNYSIYSNAVFNKSESEVWSAMYTIATEQYNTIDRESKERGYIDARKEGDLSKEYFTVKMSEDTPYRVTFQVRKDVRTKNLDGKYTSWHSEDGDFYQYYNRLRLRLYGLLIGEIEISNELQDQVDAYNMKQKKERTKIVKGVHY